jgi:putative methyltransferase
VVDPHRPDRPGERVVKPYHRLLRAGMRSVGMLSDGIRLGYQTGFDSGTMVDYVYRNEAHGITPLGRLIDRMMLNHIVWQGVRARRRLLIDQLREVLVDRPGATVFDTASGPGSYLFELPRGAYWAGDASRAEVDRGRSRATREGRDDIRFVEADAFDPATWPRPQFDVLVSSGFFDILADVRDVRRLLEAGTATTRPGARWVFSVMEDHPDLAMLHDVLVDFNGRRWVAVTRTAEEVLDLAAPHGWRPVRIEREPRRLFAVVTMARGADEQP